MSENERLQNLVRGHTKIPDEVVEPWHAGLIGINVNGYPVYIPQWLYDEAIKQGKQDDFPLWKDE